MKYTGTLISADFEERTMEFEIQEDEFTVKAGTYVILSIDEYTKLTQPGLPEPPKARILKHEDMESV